MGRKPTMELVRPVALKPGNLVAIAAPGACLTQDGRVWLGQAVSALERLGFRVNATPDPVRQKYYLAGEDRERAEELMSLFSDPAIRAIFCARGGYGSQRIIPFLDPRVIRDNPKVFVGSSDITALLVYLLEACHLVPFHGPNVATKQFLEGGAKRTQESLRETLALGLPSETPRCRTLKGGIGKGKIKGGCLSLLVTTIGTGYEVDLRGAVLFVEDVNEPLYRIDRMLTHMRHAGKLDQIVGLVLGEMEGCQDGGGANLESVVLDLFRDQEIPIILGFPSGHGEKNLTIPLGVEVTLDGESGRLIFDESGLSVP
jgi:muramoyltetrapeptide carboxypeptidase